MIAEVLEDWVTRWIRATHERSSPIAAIERQRCAYASSYNADIVTVRLDSGDRFRFFLKDFGSTGFPKDDPARRRERERRVYEEILKRTGLGTAECYGSIWDESCGTFWLLLELVNGPELRAADFEYWTIAAGWLGQLHGRFAGRVDALPAAGVLVHHDRDFFLSAAERAAQTVSLISAPLARRLAAALTGYESLVEVWIRQPRTLLHGHFRPCNVIVDLAAAPVRVCPVDWEQAAIGCGVYDLAFIADGFDPHRLHVLIDAYRRQALGHHLAVPDADEICYLVDCFRLFMRINALGRARERGMSEKKVERTIDVIESLGQLAGLGSPHEA